MEIKTVIKNLPTNESPEITYILPNLFQKMAEERKFTNSFYKATITLITKPDKNVTHTHTHKTYRPMSLRNIGSKIFNKILQNPTYNIIHHD